MNSKVYWQSNDGKFHDVDTMDVQHLRNILKMIIRNSSVLKGTKKSNIKRRDDFNMNGEIAQEDQNKIDFYTSINFNPENQQEEDDFLNDNDLFNL